MKKSIVLPNVQVSADNIKPIAKGIIANSSRQVITSASLLTALLSLDAVNQKTLKAYKTMLVKDWAKVLLIAGIMPQIKGEQVLENTISYGQRKLLFVAIGSIVKEQSKIDNLLTAFDLDIKAVEQKVADKSLLTLDELKAVLFS